MNKNVLDKGYSLQCVKSSQPYQKLIDHALELEQREGQINMCNALEELRQEGRWEGILEGIRATVRTCRNFNISETDTVRNIMNEFSLSQEEAVNYVKKYW